MLRPVLAVPVLVAPFALALASPPVLANPPITTPPPNVTSTVRLPVPPQRVTPVVGSFLEATFNDVPLGVVDTSYQARGITFACNGTGCQSAHAYAALMNPVVTTPGQNQVVSPFAGNTMPSFDDRSGAIQAAFNKACTSVSVLALVVAGPEGTSTPTKRPYLMAFAANGQQVGATTYGAAPQANGTPVQWQQLNVNSTSAAPIASMRFGVEYTTNARSSQATFDSVVCTY